MDWSKASTWIHEFEQIPLSRWIQHRADDTRGNYCAQTHACRIAKIRDVAHSQSHPAHVLQGMFKRYLKTSIVNVNDGAKAGKQKEAIINALKQIHKMQTGKEYAPYLDAEVLAAQMTHELSQRVKSTRFKKAVDLAFPLVLMTLLLF